jgi:hypothetical protein
VSQRQNSLVKYGGERGIRTPHEATDSLEKTDQHTEKDTEPSVVCGRDLTRVVNSWSKLPPALKAAILAIVNSSEGAP